MRFIRLNSAIPLFDRWQDHSSVPTELSEAAAYSADQGRTEGRRVLAPSLTATSMAERCRSAWTMLAVVGALVATCVIDRDARSQPLSETSSAVSDHLNSFIAEASERFGIPAAWIRAILRVEGGEDTRVGSRKGAIALMQLPPEMWTELRLRYALGDEPSDPRDSILAGTAHLREMYDRYGSKGFVAAYHVGATRYDEHLRTGSPLPLETQAYVAVLAPLIEHRLNDLAGSTARAKVTSWRKAPLFVAQPKRGSSNNPSASSMPTEHFPPSQPDADQPAFAPHSSGLFVRRGMEGRSQ